MNTYEWIITKLEVIPQVNNVTNYVVKIHWTLVATDGVIKKETFGLHKFEVEDNLDDYIPYELLTKENIEQWLESSDYVELIKKGLDIQIEEESEPTIVSMPIPWF